MRLPVSSARCKRIPVQTQLENLGRALTSVVQSGVFESANGLAREYGASIKAALQAAPNEQTRETIFASATASLERAIRLARITRSHLAFRLAALQREMAYQAHAINSSRWSIDC